MEPNESSHHHHQHRLTSPYFYTATASAGTAVPSSTNGFFPPSPPPPQPQSNDGSSSSIAVYPHSVPSTVTTAPVEPLKRKRGRPRKYVTPEEALAAKKMASSASSSSAKEKREALAAAGITSGSSKKSKLGCQVKSGQSFTPHIFTIAPGEDVAQKIVVFANESKHDVCVLSASGTISNVSFRGNVSYEGEYGILEMSGQFIRAEDGSKTGSLSVSLTDSDGEVFGGAIGAHLIAATLVQVTVATLQLNRKKETESGGKGKTRLSPPPPASTGPMLGMSYHPGMESAGMKGDEEHEHHLDETSLGVSHRFMMQQATHGMHMTHSRPSEWGLGGNSGHDGRGGGGAYNFSGRIGHESSENEDYEQQQIPD